MSRILIISSVGGHLSEVMRLTPVLRAHEVSLVVNDEVNLPAYDFKNVYRIRHAERDWRVAVNFAEAASVLARENPDVILSTGAGPVVPFALLARALRVARIVYVETAAAVTQPTLTGRIMYRLANDFYYQWPALRKWFPRGNLLGLIFP